MRHPWSSQRFEAGARAAGASDEVIEAAKAAAARIKSVHADLPVVFSLNHLAQLTDISLLALQSIVDGVDDPYRVFRVKKRARPNQPAPARRYRTICVPNPILMRVQRWITQNILCVVQPHPASFAFFPGTTIMQAAQQHAECRWLLKLDARRFFESITEQQVYRVFKRLGYGPRISFEMTRLSTRRANERNGVLRPGHLPQGAPTSPMLANYAVHDLDVRLSALAERFAWTYTRYADDLTFSTKTKSTRGRALKLAQLAKHELKQFGLVANSHKTSLSPPGARKIVLGLLVDRESPQLSRKFRNNVETHIYALTSNKVGPEAHRMNRGFDSIIGLRRHVAGLIAYARQVDTAYANKLSVAFEEIDWTT